MQIPDRIKALRRVPATMLHAHPRNWRKHPKHQAKALAQILAAVGWCDVLLTREREDGQYELIDGHLRKDLAGTGLVPILVLDVTESEARKILATHDPLTAMARADVAKLTNLLAEVLPTIHREHKELATMLRSLAQPDRPPNKTTFDELYQVIIDVGEHADVAYALEARMKEEGHRAHVEII